MYESKKIVPHRNYLSRVVGLFFLVSFFHINAADLTLPDPLDAGWDGKSVCEKLFEDKTKRILRCSFPPGVGHERHYHISHFGYAISGGKVRIKDKKGVREVNLSSGSSFTSDGVAWHEILNVGETTIVYLIVENKSKMK